MAADKKEKECPIDQKLWEFAASCRPTAEEIHDRKGMIDAFKSTLTVIFNAKLVVAIGEKTWSPGLFFPFNVSVEELDGWSMLGLVLNSADLIDHTDDISAAQIEVIRVAWDLTVNTFKHVLPRFWRIGLMEKEGPVDETLTNGVLEVTLLPVIKGNSASNYKFLADSGTRFRTCSVATNERIRRQCADQNPGFDDMLCLLEGMHRGAVKCDRTFQHIPNTTFEAVLLAIYNANRAHFHEWWTNSSFTTIFTTIVASLRRYINESVVLTPKFCYREGDLLWTIPLRPGLKAKALHYYGHFKNAEAQSLLDALPRTQGRL